MNNRQDRTFEMFHQVLNHVDRTRLEAPPPLLRQMRTQLADTIRRVQSLRDMQQSGSLEIARGNVTELKREIRRRRMIPLARVMRPLLRFAPGEHAVWSVPHARASAKAIGEHAVRMAKFLAPHSKLLSAAGYDRAFMKALDADGRRLMQGEGSKTKGLNIRGRATRDLAAEIKKGMETVGIIEGLLMFHGGQQKKSPLSWARRVKKRMGRPKVKRSRSPEQVS